MNYWVRQVIVFGYALHYDSLFLFYLGMVYFVCKTCTWGIRLAIHQMNVWCFAHMYKYVKGDLQNTNQTLLKCSLWPWNHITMLQKLSKCVVKAWLCWYLISLPPLRFCVKSHFGESKRSKNVVYGNFRDAELWILLILGLESCSDLLKINIQSL